MFPDRQRLRFTPATRITATWKTLGTVEYTVVPTLHMLRDVHLRPVAYLGKRCRSFLYAVIRLTSFLLKVDEFVVN